MVRFFGSGSICNSPGQRAGNDLRKVHIISKEQGIILMFIQLGKPNQNAFVERFNRSFRDEVLNANLFNSVDQAQEVADDWVQDYNEFRPHESLGDVAPMEFMHRKFVKEITSHILFG